MRSTALMSIDTVHSTECLVGDEQLAHFHMLRNGLEVIEVILLEIPSDFAFEASCPIFPSFDKITLFLDY